MLFKKGSKNYVLATLNTVERMLREIRAEIKQNSEGDVNTFPTHKTHDNENPAGDIYDKGVNIDVDKENYIDLKDLSHSAEQTERELGIGYHKEKPTDVYNTDQAADYKNSEALSFKSASRRKKADTSQSANGEVNIDTKVPKQSPNGDVPVIKPNIKTEDPAVEVHNDSDAIVNEEGVAIPSKDWESLSKQTEKDLKLVKDGQGSETPDIYNDTEIKVPAENKIVSKRISK